MGRVVLVLVCVGGFPIYRGIYGVVRIPEDQYI